MSPTHAAYHLTTIRGIHRRRLLVLAAMMGGLATPSAVARADNRTASATVQDFYGALLKVMHAADELGVRGRYETLKPAMSSAFDLPAMARISVGPLWSDLTEDERKDLVSSFSDWVIATYAERFDGYSGEVFRVDDEIPGQGAHKIVRTRLIKSDGEAIQLNYNMRENDKQWRIIDVYLTGTISEMASRRAEFTALVRSGGAPKLIQELRSRAAKLLGN